MPGAPDATGGWGVPPGVHPLDDSTAVETPPVSADTPQSWTPGIRPWAVDQAHAVAVWQRAARRMSCTAVAVPASGFATLAQELRGRLMVKVWVPSAAAAGVIVAESIDKVNAGAGVIFNPGDGQDLPVEDAAYAATATPGTATTINVVDLYNPPDTGWGSGI